MCDAVVLTHLMRWLVHFGRMALQPPAASACQRPVAFEIAGWIHRQHFVVPAVRYCISNLDYKCQSFAAVAGLASSRVDIAEELSGAQKKKMKSALGSNPGIQVCFLPLCYLLERS